MKLRIYIKDRFDAVTSVISAILAITIVIVAALSTVFWGIPYVDELRNKESLENAEMQFNLLIDNMKDIIIGNADSKNVLSVAVEEGTISVDNSSYDRTILMYSLKGISKYNFSVAGLDDNNKWFNLIMSDYSNIKAKGFFYNDPSDPNNYHEENFTDFALSEKWSPFDLKGRVCILLYDGVRIPDNLFGKIWLFDSISLKFNLHTNEGNHELSMEKGGIIYIKDGDSRVKRLFNVYFEDSTFGLHVLQTLFLESFSADGNGFNIKISIECRGSWMQQKPDDDIYNLRLQLHGDNAQTWLDYINKKHENKFVITDNNTLFLSESGDGYQISFLNSIVDIDKI